MLSFEVRKDNQAFIGDHQVVIILSIGSLGAIVCLWRININSYHRLNSQKFRVIHEKEIELPFAPDESQWKLLGEATH